MSSLGYAGRRSNMKHDTALVVGMCIIMDAALYLL
jgi:preprotein translocase subunit SecE